MYIINLESCSIQLCLFSAQTSNISVKYSITNYLWNFISLWLIQNEKVRRKIDLTTETFYRQITIQNKRCINPELRGWGRNRNTLCHSSPERSWSCSMPASKSIQSTDRRHFHQHSGTSLPIPPTATQNFSLEMLLPGERIPRKRARLETEDCCRRRKYVTFPFRQQ